MGERRRERKKEGRGERRRERKKEGRREGKKGGRGERTGGHETHSKFMRRLDNRDAQTN